MAKRKPMQLELVLGVTVTASCSLEQRAPAFVLIFGGALWGIA
ncbi:MAG: hypothetical protein AAB325_09430 [Pseudomonadota bacterium]